MGADVVATAVRAVAAAEQGDADAGISPDLMRLLESITPASRALWGKPGWLYLLQWARSIPRKQTLNDRQRAFILDRLVSFGRMLPCSVCSADFLARVRAIGREGLSTYTVIMRFLLRAQYEVNMVKKTRGASFESFVAHACREMLADKPDPKGPVDAPRGPVPTGDPKTVEDMIEALPMPTKREWGRPGWEFLLQWASTLPRAQLFTDTQRAAVATQLLGFAAMLPCGVCANDFRRRIEHAGGEKGFGSYNQTMVFLMRTQYEVNRVHKRFGGVDFAGFVSHKIAVGLR